MNPTQTSICKQCQDIFLRTFTDQDFCCETCRDTYEEEHEDDNAPLEMQHVWIIYFPDHNNDTNNFIGYSPIKGQIRTGTLKQAIRMSKARAFAEAEKLRSQRSCTVLCTKDAIWFEFRQQ